MKRRALLLGISSLAATRLTWAQQASKVHRIGLLGVASPATYARQIEAFRQGLRDLGYVEGGNVAIEFRWAEGNAARLPELAAELVRLKPDVIVTSGPGTTVAKRATGSIPIVMAASTNAAETGLVASLSHPGGNVTGSTSFARELSLKRLELLRDAFPRANRVGLLLHSQGRANPALIQAMQDAARTLKVRLQVVEVDSPADFERAFATFAKERAEALIVADHTMLVAEAPGVSRLALSKLLPTIGSVEIADAGGLLAYGADFPALWARAASYVDKILKGAKPADLPVEQPARFEFIVNLRTAKALGVTIPSALQIRASRVID